MLIVLRINWISLNQLEFKPTFLVIYRDVKFSPLGAVQENALIVFHIPASPHYMDLSKTYFKTMVEILDANGTSLSGKSFTDYSEPSILENVGVINYLGKTLWQQIDF